MIKSALVSAQNRVRLHWTNIPNFEQPADIGLVLGDILDDFGDFKYYAGKQLQPKWLEMDHNGKPRIESVRTTEQKSGTLLASMYKGHVEGYVKKPKQVATATDIKGHDIIKRVYSGEGKSPALTTMQGGHRQPKVSITETDKYYQMNREGAYPNQQQDRVRKAEKPSNTLTGAGSSIPNVSVAVGAAFRGRSKNEDGKHVDWKSTKPQQELETRKDEKSNSLSSVTKDSLVAIKQRPRGVNKGGIKALDGKTPTMTSSKWEDNNHVVVGIHYRKLTPMECERLQTLPDNYTDGVSNTQRYKMIGNGWTIEVIKHILSHIERE